MYDLPDTIEGPTPELLRHREVVARRTGGFWVLTRLEKMLLRGEVTRQQFQAGESFARDYLTAYEGSTSSLMVSPIRSQFDPSDGRHLAAIRFNEARAKLDATCPRASEFLLALLVDNESFSRIGQWLGISDKTCKRRVAAWCDVLATHYNTRH